MNRYGQAITWGPLSAPQLFTGETRQYSYRDSLTKQLITDMSADNMAMILHSHKADISFEAVVGVGSSNFLDLSAGAAIAVSGITGGTVLVRRAVETWRLGQPKTASTEATYYPDITTQTGAGSVGELNAITPDQSALGIVYPGGKLVYGTFGLTHAAGIVHGLTIEQILQITEDDPSPDGKILGATSHGYERNIKLDLLATGPSPVVGTVLAITGAPDHASGYQITGADVVFEDQRGKMFAIEAAWIPAMSTTQTQG